MPISLAFWTKTQVDKHRVILANEPRLLRDLLKRVFEHEPHVQVLEADAQKLPVPQSQGELLIIALDRQGKIPRRLLQLLRRHTLDGGIPFRVLGVAPDGSQARLYRPRQADEVWDPVMLDDLRGLICEPETS